MHFPPKDSAGLGGACSSGTRAIVSVWCILSEIGREAYNELRGEYWVFNLWFPVLMGF